MKTRVLLVDDSKTALYALERLLTQSGLFEVVGRATHASEALALAQATTPDLVTMDVYLDGHDGIDVARSILAKVTTRIVMVTALDASRANLAFQALAAGALDVLAKPSASDDEQGERQRRRFLSALSALSRVALLRGPAKVPAKAVVQERSVVLSDQRLVALGASTGGPQTLARILRGLPSPFELPVIIVQHIEDAHSRAFAEWLGETGHEVLLVEQPTQLRRGVVYVANGHSHLCLEAQGQLVPQATPPRKHQLPSVDELFESLARVRPRQTFAALLTGMGDDGALGLHALAAAGATTVIQSLDSCAIPGMPAAALARTPLLTQLPPEEIARAAIRFAVSSSNDAKSVIA